MLPRFIRDYRCSLRSVAFAQTKEAKKTGIKKNIKILSRLDKDETAESVRHVSLSMRSSEKLENFVVS